MNVSADGLRRLIARIFFRGGCSDAEAARVADYLVEANLVGHDSHGVIRTVAYIDWLLAGKVLADRDATVVLESDSLAVLDGNFGFGQTIGEQAVDRGIEKCRRQGVAVIALRNSGHLGRIGDWPLRAARAGLTSLHFVNTSGAGMLVAPFGGIDRRLSACPIAAGVPTPGGEPLLVDVSMCTIAEGKIRVALNKGVPVPDGCIIDSQGRPTNEPRVFYADPPGAILPMGQHKGYALAMITEVLAGAFTGGSCTSPEHAQRLANSMFSVYFSPSHFGEAEGIGAEIARFIEFVKSSRRADEEIDILVPGEVETRSRAVRLRDGVSLDPSTWRQLLDTAARVGIEQREAEGLVT